MDDSNKISLVILIIAIGGLLVAFNMPKPKEEQTIK